jgi:hypothetical protein
MLNETDAIAGIIARLQENLPVGMNDSVISYLDKPEQLTGTYIEDNHPLGLFLVQYMESSGPQTEIMIYGIACLATTLDRVYRLTRAVKVILTGWQIPGATRFELHEDKPMAADGGIVGRVVAFSCGIPAVKMSNGQITAALEALEI